MADASAAILAQLQVLRERYAAELPDKLLHLRTGLDQLRVNWDNEQLQTLHRQAHSLTGSGATFGYNDISDAARKLEQLLKTLLDSAAKPESIQLKKIATLLTKLEQAERIPVANNLSTTPILLHTHNQSGNKKSHNLIMVVADDTHLANEQRQQYGLHGYEVNQLNNFNSLEKAIKQQQPLAIIMDIMFPEGDLAGINQIAKLRQQLGADLPPVIFVSQREDLETRLASVRAGAAAYYTKPIDLASMIETLDRLTSQDDDAAYRILIVDDDESMAYHNALMLQRAGMDTRVLTDPKSILEILPEFQPELILMDLYLPGCTGIELAAVIRQQEIYVGTPIVFFSVETDISKHLDAMRAGGDDFLIKPIDPDHLLASVEARVHRARAITSLMVRDSLTGLLNHTAIEEQLMRELGLQLRHDGVLSYAIIDIDNFKQVNDRYGHAAGDKVIRSLSRLLRQRFRTTDLLGRYGGEEFVVVLPATDSRLATRLLDDVRAAFSQLKFSVGDRSFSVSFSAGIASAPPYTECISLQGEADKALYLAKEAGRNRVITAEHHPPT